MTPDEERERLRYLQLKARASAAAPAPAVAAPSEDDKPTRAGAALAGVQNLGSFGWGDEIGAGFQASLAKLSGNGEFKDTYRHALRENRERATAAKKEHPYFYYGAGAPAALASAAAMPALKAGQGASLLARALYGVGNGVLQGGLAGAGESEADTLGGVAKDAAVGAGLGGAVGGVLPLAGAAVKTLARGVVRPSAAAQELAHLGVDTSKMTLGQLNPEGVMAQMEESGQHALGSGNLIRAQREAGNQAWRDAVLSKATAPYSPLAGGTNTAERLATAYEGFSPVYDAIGDNAVQTAGAGKQSVADQLRGAFGRVTGDESVLATDADRAALSRYLDNQASALHFQPGEASSVGDLQAVRSNIRQQLSQALRGPNPNQASAQMLQNAEREVTQQIERNLPADAQAALRATDARYGLHKTVEDAVRRAGDKPEGLMPQHLSAAVKAATNRGAYARGAGGDLRELATAGREVLQTKTPPTGVRALIQALPGSHYVQSPLAGIANLGPVKRALLGETAAQQYAQALVDALSASPTANTLANATGREATAVLPGDFVRALRGESP